MKKLAFQKLLQKHKDRIFSYAFYFLHNREDAEDVTQEVFVRLWQHWDKIDRNRVVAWMIRVAHNQCVDLVRHKKNSSGYFRNSVQLDIEKIPEKEGDPALNYEQKESQKALLSALEMLPEKTKSMLLLHYFHGLKCETIGEILDTNVNTVKVAIHRGRKMLRHALSEQFPERSERYRDGYAMP